jgi:hypothetical protein
MPVKILNEDEAADAVEFELAQGTQIYSLFKIIYHIHNKFSFINDFAVKLLRYHRPRGISKSHICIGTGFVNLYCI